MLKGQVALVTGAGRGIGKAITLRLVADGMKVAITARSAEQLETTRADAVRQTPEAQVLCLPGDVSDPAAAKRSITETRARLGPIDLLVNNAGIGEPVEHRLWEANIDDWWRVMEVNLRGPMLFMHYALPGMVERNRGRIINIGALRAVTAVPVQTAYAAAKAGLTRLTHTVNTSLVGTDVHIFDLSPGRVQTDLVRETSPTSVVQKATADSWTPIERPADIVAQIATGSLDALSGRFLHARDDLEDMKRRAEEIRRNDGRVLRFSPAFDGDPMRYPGEPARR